MATSTQDRERVRLYLKSAELAVADLPEVASEWEQLDMSERMSLSLEWSNATAQLESLAAYSSSGLLSPELLDRYERLLGRVRELEPTVQHLGLSMPGITV